MKKGEIWKVRLPPAIGHVQAGDRPAIIVQNEPLILTLPTVLVVPLTGILAANRFASTLTIQPDAQNGLTIPSVAFVFQLRALDKQNLLHRLGELDATSLSQVLAEIAALTG